MQEVLEDGVDSRARDGTHNLLRASTRIAAFLDWWTMDSTNLCTNDCRTTIELGTSLGAYAGTRQIWPELFKDTVRAASDADNPTEDEIASLGASITGSMCSSKGTSASSLVLAAEPYIVQGIPDLSDDTLGFVRMVERMLKVMYGPTEYGAGHCSENEHANMFAKMAQLGTRHAVKLLENPWEGEWVYDSWREYCSDCYPYGGYDSTTGTVCDCYYSTGNRDYGGYRWVDTSYREDDMLMVSPGAMTAAELNSMIYDAMHCFCDYWTGPGDVFPLIESKVAQYEANEPADWGEEFAEAGQLAMNSAKTCKSMSCRGLFDSAFALVDKLSGFSFTQGITFNNEPACNAVHADKCWRGECWPIDNEFSYSNECAMCYKPTDPSSTLYPMAHVDDLADRIMFWATCSVSNRCPPADVESYQVTMTFTLSIAAADFGDKAQADFKQRFVEMLVPPGSANAGAISASDVTLIITETNVRRRRLGNGIEVQATVDVYSESVKTMVTGVLASITPAAAALKLGVPVTEMGEVAIINVAFSPPAPPTPPPGGGDGEDDGLPAGVLAGIVVGVLVGCCCCAGLGFLAFFLYKKQEAGKTASTAKQSSTTAADVVVAGVELQSKFCAGCGKQLKGDGKFCASCGAPVPGA